MFKTPIQMTELDTQYTQLTQQVEALMGTLEDGETPEDWGYGCACDDFGLTLAMECFKENSMVSHLASTLDSHVGKATTQLIFKYDEEHDCYIIRADDRETQLAEDQNVELEQHSMELFLSILLRCEVVIYDVHLIPVV